MRVRPTAAVPNREAAVDATNRGKFHRYQVAVEEWGDAGPCLRPLVWSCEGRAHPDVERMMSFCAKAVALRANTGPRDLLRRWQADVGVALAARRAQVARQCLPPLEARAAWVVHGLADEDADAGLGVSSLERFVDGSFMEDFVGAGAVAEEVPPVAEEVPRFRDAVEDVEAEGLSRAAPL